MLDWVVPRVLLVLGAASWSPTSGSLVQFLRFLRLRSRRVLTWPGPKHPPSYGLFLVHGRHARPRAPHRSMLPAHSLGVRTRSRHVFGEAMMFLYYGYLVPLQRRASAAASTRMASGWKRATCRTRQSAASRWREEPEITLLLIPRDEAAGPQPRGAARSTTPRPAACCATRSPATTSTSPASRSTSARTTSATTFRTQTTVLTDLTRLERCR